MRLRRRPTERPTDELAPTDLIAIAEVAPRRHVHVAGVVTRMRTRPTGQVPSLAVTLTDKTGTVTAVWTGRRSIGGVTLGRHMEIEGVAARRGDKLELTNPAYTLRERDPH